MKTATITVAEMTFVHYNIGHKKHTADAAAAALIAETLSQTVLQENSTSKWWLSLKIEVWNFN